MNWIVALLLGMLGGMIILFLYLYLTSKEKLLQAQKQADRIITDAKQESETLKKEKIIEAEESVYQKKQKIEKELDQKRSQLRSLERQIDQKEVDIDRKGEIVEKKEKEIELQEKKYRERETYIQQKTKELNDLINEEVQKLEEISGLTREQAKQILLKDMETAAQEEGDKITQRIIEEAKLEGGRKAREITVQAIQQVSYEQSVESTISVLTLPNDDMKGRIIGREGRNIRAFELVTGVDVIIDDTPEIVVISCYDPYRREIARLALEKLISDGRIHPARIEEVVEKTSEEMKESLKEVGEQALLELGVHGVPSEIIELLGKLKYRTSYGQNLLNHSIEVSHLCGIMAAELGLDAQIAKRAGVLHDIGKALENYSEDDHASQGSDLLRKFNEGPNILNAAEFHHDTGKASSPYTILVSAADVISGNRPGARRESLESFIQRLENLEELAEQFEGVSKAYSIQTGKELRVIVETDKIDDNRARQLSREIAKKIQEEVDGVGSVKVTVIREYRAYEYAT